MKILFLTPYPLGEAPSQRFRFEQYFKILTEKGHSFSMQSFFQSNNWKLFSNPGKFLHKLVSLISGFFRRFTILFEIGSYDWVFLHREITPIGPPIFEWLIAKILKKKIIYDFDDAIWFTDKKDESVLLRALKWRSKVADICSWSHTISCGNDYLCNYARHFNQNVIYNPTTVDTEELHNPALYPNHNDNKIIIGWTGSFSTLKYLIDLESILQSIEQKYLQIEIWIIADRVPKMKLSRSVFKPWSKASELIDLAQFSIGIMPLPNDEWSKGKCGFKAIQYMALQIPTVASPVGVNHKIIEHGTSGFLCNSADEWLKHIELLINDRELRHRMGLAGRSKITQYFSVLSNTENFLNLFQ